VAEIKIECPHCGKRYWVDDAEIDGDIECLRCEKFFTVRPVGATASAAAPAEPMPETGTKAVFLPAVGIGMMPVAPGVFRIGSGTGQPNEGPVHGVRLTYPFWIGCTPVTQAEYEKVMNGGNPSFFRGAGLPVENVDWEMAAAFCHKLTEMQRHLGRIGEDRIFRLPTEAEWEFACRGGAAAAGPAPVTGEPLPEPLPFFFGDDAARLDTVAWHKANSDGCTHPVAQKQPNALGLYDVLGNVGEWCLDWHAPYTADSTGAVVNPSGPAAGTRRVRRGGGWDSIPARCRCACRLGVAPECCSPMLGFRIVLAPVTALRPM
jgi:formylglycine-generating enzyme required for sulfatase activity